MTNKEILKGIANLLTFSKKEAEKETLNFSEIKLKDGSILNVDKLEVGGAVVDSEQKPVTAGDLELEDGTILVIAEEGIIAEVKAVSVDEKEDDETKIADDMADVQTINAEPENTNYYLEDGTVIQTKNWLDVGSVMLDADGNQLSAGEYTLKPYTYISKEIITVDENGVITKKGSMNESFLKENFVETKLEDGTNVSYDELKAGGKFLLKTDSETAIPAPKGDYVMPDGQTVTVNEDGIIATVAVNKTNDEDVIANLNERLLKVEQLLQEMESKFSKIENEPITNPVHFQETDKTPEKKLSRFEIYKQTFNK
jgi:hypothetical protein